MQQLRVEFCCAFEGRKQPAQALRFIFRIANGVILLLRQLEDQLSGCFFVERLGIQNAVQICLRCGMLRYACSFRLRDVIRLLCQSAKQVRGLLLDLRGRRLGADASQRFLHGRSLWQALLGLALGCGCFK